jgi:hypothetical protein
MARAGLLRRIFDGVGLSQRERVLWTCASLCLPVLLLLSLPLTWGGLVARDKYILFVLLLALPLAGFATTRPSRVVASLVSPASLNRFLALNLGFILLVTPWLASVTFGEPLSSTVWRSFAVAYVCAVGVLLALAVRSAEVAEEYSVLELVNRVLITVTPVAFVAATVFPVQWAMGFSRKFALLGAGFAAAVCLVGLLQPAIRFPASPPWIRSLALWSGPVVASILMMDVQLDYDALHYTAYLAPSAAVSGGRIPLLDVFCQYGQPYLLYNAAFLILPATFHSAALVTALVNVLYTVCLIAILRKVVRNDILFVVLGIALPILFWLVFSSNRTPSLGGMRYLPVTLLGAVLVFMPARRCFTTRSIAAISLCWLWSFEAAVYGTFVYVSFAIAVGVIVTDDLAGVLRYLARFLALLFATIAALALGVVSLYLIFTGHVPRYDLYVAQVLAYVGPDPFMEYNFFRQGFFAWAPVLVGFFMVPCLIVLGRTTPVKMQRLPEVVVIWALAIVFSVYCLLSTQPLYVVLAMMPLLLLLIVALDIAWSDREQAFTVSELGLAPVFVLVVALLTGVAGFNFVVAPSYANGVGSMLSELVHNHRLAPPDFRTRLGEICYESHDLDVGNACSGDTPMLNPYYREFSGLIQKWQGDQKTIFAFHPSDALLDAALNKPYRLPVTFAYVDGFAPALFKYIVDRSRPVIADDLKVGDTVILTKDLPALNELQWALLKLLAASWQLKRIDESEHFTVVQLDHLSAAGGESTLVLPGRPIKVRNSL